MLLGLVGFRLGGKQDIASAGSQVGWLNMVGIKVCVGGLG